MASKMLEPVARSFRPPDGSYFLEDYPEARATVVYRGERPLERSGVRWVPVDTFLRSLGSGPFPA